MISTRDAMELYEHAAADVYGYLVRRCPSAAIAEDLTAETFLAATRALHEHDAELSVGWLIGTARHKLVDHWRREGRQRQALEELYDSAPPIEPADTTDPIDTLHVHGVLSRLTPHHRAALTLRYLDGLPVEQVAALLDRSLHATESLLVRAKAAYRSLADDRPHRRPPDDPPGHQTPHPAPQPATHQASDQPTHPTTHPTSGEGRPR